MNNGFLLFSGYNTRAVITLCRIFNQSNIPFFIVAVSDDLLYKSSYKNNIIHKRKSQKLDSEEIGLIISNCLVKHQLDKLTICPTSEFLNTFLLANREKIESDNTIIPIVNWDVYNSLTNKKSFLEVFCDSVNFYAPSEIPASIIEDSLPVVAKPYVNIKGNKSYYPQLIFNKEQLKIFLSNNSVGDYFFQEYVEGQSIYLCYYVSKKKRNVEKYGQKNLLQQPNGKSIVYASNYLIPDDLNTKLIEDKLLNMNFFGWLMIEIIISNSKPYLIECNPRCWGPLWLGVNANKRLFQEFVFDFCSESIDLIANNDSEQYAWVGGINGNLENYKRYGLTIDEIRRGLDTLSKYDIYNFKDTIGIFNFENNNKDKIY